MAKVIEFEEFFRIRELKDRSLKSFLKSFFEGKRELVRKEYIKWYLRFIGSDVGSMSIDGLLENNAKAAYLALCVTKPGGRVIDVGCGMGVSTLALLHGNLYDVVAVDQDEESIKRLSELAENFGSYNVKLDLKAQTFKEFSKENTVKPTDTVLGYGADSTYLPELLEHTLPTGASIVFSTIYSIFFTLAFLHQEIGKREENETFKPHGYNLTLAWDPKSPRSSERLYDRLLFLAEKTMP